MTIYALLGLILTIFSFITMVLTIVVISTKKTALYDEVKGERDALDQLTKADQKTQYELQDLSLEELRNRAKEPW